METTSTTRVAPALAVVAVVRDFGLDPMEILTEAGWAPALLDDPDKIVPFVALGRLFAVAASRTGCSHFGLLVGQKAGPSVLGAPSFVSRTAPDVRSALRMLTRHFAHHGRGAVVTFSEEDKVATLSHRILAPKMPGSRHIIAAALAIGFQLMKILCGPNWRPLQTSFALRRPADVKPFKKLFGDTVCFDTGESALSFAAHWLDREVAGADPELQRLLLRVVGDGPTKAHDLRDDVRSTLSGMIGRQNVDLAAVASTFNLSNRTMHRRLAALGTNFQKILDDVRHEMALQLLEDTTMPIAQVALTLGYSEVSAFTRSFKRRFECGPATWRASSARRVSDGQRETTDDHPI